MTATNEDLIGRSDMNDLEAILSVSNTDPDAAEHPVASSYDTLFTWDYDKGSKPRLDRLYEKAKTSQWNAQTDLPWDTDVDQEKIVAANTDARAAAGMAVDVVGTPFEHWSQAEWVRLGVESQNWMLSQFLHGEQGALLCTSRIVETVPWIDAKYYAATQVMDEARHVEVFSKYLDEKLSGHYPINAHLGLLLDDIIGESRWDMTYLGMQIMVEGLALAAFGFLHDTTTEPLLKQLLRYVMSDEARHVAFGVLSLKEFYAGLSTAELMERKEFAFEAAVRMRDRFLQQEVWEHMGVPVAEAMDFVRRAPDRQLFQRMLFAKIVPNCKKLGLLDNGDTWLRERFTDLGVIDFEHMPDTGEEFEVFQLAQGEVAQGPAKGDRRVVEGNSTSGVARPG
ncbi:MAG: ferritin-like domain-containing protein [Actinomycetota bacterium]|nr:ferritin-like domain-containing protein [Actinomycetota bacterium]